ncbi:MAG: beta-ketoacyl-ACP synthase [Burkholderiales bacterium]|nr:beta-ketoacyl-ACP synthase [Burkholderiales bacterium]
MNERRVVVTGAGGITALGNSWDEIFENLKKGKNAVKYMPEWEKYQGLNSRLAAPIENFTLPPHYTRKKTRGMGRVSLLATRSTELALENAGLIGNPDISNGKTGIAFGSCTGSVDPTVDFGAMLIQNTTNQITGTTYVKMMPHTAAVNTAIFFGVKGRVITTSSACTSGSQAIGYSYEAIKHGYQDLMIAGGGEELSPAEVAVFDTLFATSTSNDAPKTTPRPFDKNRDGLVIGEGASVLILEELEHARERGAPILAEVIGFSTNCDAAHITQPSQETIRICIQNSLKDAKIPATEIGYINAHGTATQRGDIAETIATSEIFGNHVPISSLKSYYGHTLGACGALEAWLTIQMMNSDWFSPTINLKELDSECGELDFIIGEGKKLSTEVVMTNNFAFGGINTSLIFKRFDA